MPYDRHAPSSGAGPRYSASRPDPRSGQVPEPAVRPTPAQILLELNRLGAATRSGRHGLAGRPIQLAVNCFPTDISQLVTLISHFDITYEIDESDDTGGGRGGRGRGRGGRGGRGRGRGGRSKLDDRPIPVGLATKLIRNIEANYSQTDFRGATIAHDGRKNAYTSIQPDWTSRTFSAQLENTKYKVTFKVVNQVDMSTLGSYVNRQSTQVPQEAVTALDIVLRTAPLREMVYTGRGFAVPPQMDAISSMRLGNGCEAWMCYYQAFRPHDTGMFLAFDVSYSAFYSSQTVYDFAVELIGTPSGQDTERGGQSVFNQPLSAAQIGKLENELRGVKIEQSYQPISERKPLTIKRITPQAATDINFEDSNRRMSIAEHFAEMGQALNHPHLPCIDVQSGKQGHTYIPIEKATIISGQMMRKKMTPEMKERMANIGARSPLNRMDQIGSSLGEINKQTQDYLRAFGVKVNMDKLTIPARILSPPVIQVGGGVTLDIPSQKENEFSWSMQNHTFYQFGKSLKHWGVLVLAPQVKKYDAQKFTKGVMHICHSMGVEVSEPRYKFGYVIQLEKDMIDLVSEIRNNPEANGQCDLIMVIKKDTATRDYNLIKNTGDTYLGVPTQCVVAPNALNPTELYCLNLALKINAKLGGINCRIPGDSFGCLGKRFMIIGASVTHASSLEAKGEAPSVASVVGSMDKRCGRHDGVFRLQDPKEQGIFDIGAMVRDLLQNFGEKEHFLPDHLLIYRNGVSDGQFANVLSTELNDIREKVKELSGRYHDNSYNPTITFIVAQRGHRTRFIPTDEGSRDKSGNCAPGTVIDREISHPVHYDFYLISHNGIQGTSTPRRYTILKDDLNLSPDQIQELTYHLCYTFVRCTRSISVVPSIYYADLLSARIQGFLSARNPARLQPRENQPPVQRESILPKEYSEGKTILIHKNLTGRFYYV